MKAKITKRCAICGQSFHPDCRTQERQTVCDNLNCRQQRKRQSQRRWCQQNPGYFKGRYPSLKDQIYRRRQVTRSPSAPKKLTLRHGGIQDELTVNKNKYLNLELRLQDELTYVISITKQRQLSPTRPVYKIN